MVGFPSGQRGQTVNLLAPPSKVRILLHPANLALTSLRCRGYFFCEKGNRKGAQGRAPLHTPGPFLQSAAIEEGRKLLTCACMLLYWQFNTEPKRGKQNFVYSRRRAPHVESLVAATLQQSAQRPIFNTEEYRQKSIKTHLPQSKHSTSHRHSVTQPTPKNTKTSQQGHTSPQPGTLKKSPRGVQRGRGFTAPLRFSFFPKKEYIV